MTLNEKIIEIFNNKRNWHSNLVRDKVLEVNKEFIKELKEEFENVVYHRGERFVVNEVIDKLAGEELVE